jgi:hypothetical protein
MKYAELREAMQAAIRSAITSEYNDDYGAHVETIDLEAATTAALQVLCNYRPSKTQAVQRMLKGQTVQEKRKVDNVLRGSIAEAERELFQAQRQVGSWQRQADGYPLGSDECQYASNVANHWRSIVEHWTKRLDTLHKAKPFTTPNV